jgi:hypothetical protein
LLWPGATSHLRCCFAAVAGCKEGKGERNEEAGKEKREGKGNEHVTINRRVQSRV